MLIFYDFSLEKVNFRRFSMISLHFTSRSALTAANPASKLTKNIMFIKKLTGVALRSTRGR